MYTSVLSIDSKVNPLTTYHYQPRLRSKAGHWLYVHSASMVLLLAGISAIATNRISAETTITVKDAQQDDHLTAIDNRIDQADKDRNARRLETVAHRDKQDAQISDNAQRISKDEGIGMGILSGLTLLQMLGFLKSWKDAKADSTPSRRRAS